MRTFWAFGILAVAAVAAGASENIKVHLYDEVGLKPRAIAKAERDTAEIFRRAGIEMEFHHCSKAAYNCREGVDPRVFVVVIASGDHRENPNSNSSLGFAMPRVGRANHLAALYPRVVEFAERDSQVPVERVLAAVIAHELGHLIFGDNHHEDGIMKAAWQKPDLAEIKASRMVFSPSQAARLHDGLLARR